MPVGPRAERRTLTRVAGRWFSARCTFGMECLELINGQGDFAHEERITVWFAASFEAAVAMAEDDASSTPAARPSETSTEEPSCRLG